jgi:hypothetical protein
MRATRAKLSALCDSLISVPTNGRVTFTPISDFVLMNFADFPHSFFVGHEDRGTSSERELSFTIPGIYKRFEGPLLVQFGFALLTPFLFLDNSVAIATGREVHGYFKQAGWVELPGGPDLAEFTVDVLGCDIFALGAKWGRKRLLTLDEPAREIGRDRCRRPCRGTGQHHTRRD